jgi:hypothetical protein
MITPRRLTSTFSYVLGGYAKLRTFFALSLSEANSPKANRASRLRIARSVAVLVSLYMGIGLSTQAEAINFNSSKDLIKYVANKQLTDKQYHCHNEIVYIESRWNERAIGNIGGTKQAYGLYQLKIASMRTAHVEVQFWKYWEYVSYRYGVTEYDEPMYCAALSHLKTKGWQ